jgi:hypothetical protein
VLADYWRLFEGVYVGLFALICLGLCFGANPGVGETAIMSQSTAQ